MISMSSLWLAIILGVGLCGLWMATGWDRQDRRFLLWLVNWLMLFGLVFRLALDRLDHYGNGLSESRHYRYRIADYDVDDPEGLEHTARILGGTRDSLCENLMFEKPAD